MSYFLGKAQLGQWLSFALQCTDANDTPAMPVDTPMLRIRRASDGVTAYNKEMPVTEKEGTAIGLFIARVFLGTGFQAGYHTAEMSFTAGAFTAIQLRTFEISPGGNPNGVALGMNYYRRPNASHVLYQVEAGRILRGTNPRIT